MTDTRNPRDAGDRDELERAQHGDRRAFHGLYESHAAMTWRLALVAGRDPAVAEAAVVGSFARVLGRSDRRDLLRFAPADAQLLRSARESAVEKAGRTPEPTGLDVIGQSAHPDTLRAFDRLPERWRSVLWLDQIEGLALGTTAAAVDATEQSAAGLTTRALAGFREQLAQLQVHPDMSEDCRQATIRLSGYAARALPSRETIRVRRHLDRCEGCRTRLDDLDDVTPHLRGALPPLPIAIETLALGAWLARAREEAGPIGLRMPSGALAPAWVERSLAGATAAVVSLGITAALLLGTRDRTNPVTTESAVGQTDEQAFQGDDVTEDGGADGPSTVVDVPPTSSSDDLTSSDASTSDGSGSGADPAPPAVTPASTPRGGSSPTAPDQPPRPSPSAPSPTPAPSDPTPPSTPPPSDPPDSVDDVVGAVDDVVDDVCGALGPVCETLPIEAPLPGLQL